VTSLRRILTALPPSLLALVVGGCALEPFSDPVPVPANYTPPVYSSGGAAQANPAQANPSTPVVVADSPAPAATGQANSPIVTPTTQPLLDDLTRDQVFAAARVVVGRRFSIDTDPKLNEYLMLVGSLVTINTPRPDVEYSYILLRTEQPISFGVYPKTLCISRGLLTQMRDESELAGVLAREISNLIAARGPRAAHLPVPADLSPTTAATTLPSSRPTTAPVAATEPALPPPGSAQAARVNKLAGALLDLLIKDDLAAEAQQAADVEGAKFAAAARYAPDGYLRLLTRLKPLSTSAEDASAWDRIKALDAGLQIIAKAYPTADARLPARFESYVTPGVAAGRP